MEQTRKNLKTVSVVVLALAGLSLLNLLFEIFFGELGNATVPEGAPENTLLITQIFVLVISVLLLLPQAYVGIKGIRIAKTPDSSKGHIIWGIILVVFTAAGLLSPFLALVRGEGVAFENIAELCSIMVDVSILVAYVSYAMAIRREIE